MDVVRENKSVAMIRETMDGLPEFNTPEGFSIRFYEPGDEETWRAVVASAERFMTIKEDLFRHEFGKESSAIHDRMHFLCGPDGNVIGTATAWFDERYRGARYGRVHWVAIRPEFQGRGLAKPLLAGVCRRLVELGHDRAYLITSSGRIPAINLYRSFGFVADIRDEDDREVWREIEKLLK